VRHDEEVKRAKKGTAKRKGHKRHSRSELGRAAAADHEAIMGSTPKEDGGKE
jgi:hypothetical protein